MTVIRDGLSAGWSREQIAGLPPLPSQVDADGIVLVSFQAAFWTIAGPIFRLSERWRFAGSGHMALRFLAAEPFTCTPRSAVLVISPMGLELQLNGRRLYSPPPYPIILVL